MPSKTPCTCPVCHRLGLINLSQHLNGVHSITGQERKRLIQKGMVELEVMVTESQSHIVFFTKAHQLPSHASMWRAFENRTDEKSHTRRTESHLGTLFEYE